MEHAARRRRFDDLLGHQREEEHHRDVVDRERDRIGEAVVALGRGIDPHQGDQRAQRQQEQVLDGEPRQARNSRSHAGAVGRAAWRVVLLMGCLASARPGSRPDCLWITPESTVLPVREIAWKNISVPAISTSMKLWS